MPRITALALLVCAGLSSHAYAEIYRWTDANGAVHFSDEPPKHAEHRSLKLKETVTVPMRENVRQADNVHRSRKAVGRLLESDSTEDASASRAEEEAKTARCNNIQKRLDRIQAQLRAGYGSERGNRLRAQRRELSQQYSRQCVLG
ncbi:MAG: hypothetical protein AWU57_4050 [Marinobacter sp. T13-3]|nr:MAG: hypothetical protein AWU57_4050 [Marinobacter sp. T13-3]